MPGALAAFARGLDAVVHLAGVNRAAEEEDVATGNPALARLLVAALDEAGGVPHVAYASTTHVDNDNAYGRSKQEAGEILSAWAARAGACYSEFVFPHLYGEYGRPHYNSAVTTFAWQVANGGAPSVHGDGRVELLHFFDAGGMILDALRRGASGSVRPAGETIAVRDVAARIEALAAAYRSQIVPDLSESLDLRLFNIYRGFLYPGYYPVRLTTHTDDRGALTETVKTHNGGQSFFSTTRPGITRGNHFHFHKVERFVVLKGKARIAIRRLFSEEVTDFFVSGDDLCYIDMPTLHTHAITNIGDEELVTQFWAHEIFDRDRPDTVFEPVRSS